MKFLGKIIFWLHLVIDLSAGSVISLVALTGATMAFRPQILAGAERDLTPLHSAPARGSLAFRRGNPQPHARSAAGIAPAEHDDFSRSNWRCRHLSRPGREFATLGYFGPRDLIRDGGERSASSTVFNLRVAYAISKT